MKSFGYQLGDFPVTDKHADTLISFPCDQHLTTNEINFIIDKVGNLFVNHEARLISFNGIKEQWKSEKAELFPIIEDVLSSGAYVGGSYIEQIEEKIAQLCGSKYCLTVNSGTDALVCSYTGGKTR